MPSEEVNEVNRLVDRYLSRSDMNDTDLQDLQRRLKAKNDEVAFLRDVREQLMSAQEQVQQLSAANVKLSEQVLTLANDHKDEVDNLHQLLENSQQSREELDARLGKVHDEDMKRIENMLLDIQNTQAEQSQQKGSQGQGGFWKRLFGN